MLSVGRWLFFRIKNLAARVLGYSLYMYTHTHCMYVYTYLYNLNIHFTYTDC